MINAIHFVLDLETMSTAPNAAIAAIGCVRVQQGEIVDEFYERVDLESSRAMGGEIDTPTLQWWLTQPQEARQEVSGELPAIHITTALGKLSEFMRRGDINDDQPLVWGNGSSFDNVILGSAYQRTGLAMPWKFWNDRDLRTLLALYPQAKKVIAFEGIKHHALNDARYEARQLIAALELHAARTVANRTPIQAVNVERDQHGHWTHAAWPATDDETIPKAWFIDHGLELAVVDFEGDAPQELVDAYFDSGEPDCSRWDPSKPDGEDWFIFSIRDTEDGPVCVWVRPTIEAAGAQEQAI